MRAMRLRISHRLRRLAWRSERSHPISTSAFSPGASDPLFFLGKANSSKVRFSDGSMRGAWRDLAFLKKGGGGVPRGQGAAFDFLPPKKGEWRRIINLERGPLQLTYTSEPLPSYFPCPPLPFPPFPSPSPPHPSTSPHLHPHSQPQPHPPLPLFLLLTTACVNEREERR